MRRTRATRPSHRTVLGWKSGPRWLPDYPPDPGRALLSLSPRPLAHLNAEGCHPAHGLFANSHQLPPRSLAPIGRGRPSRLRNLFSGGGARGAGWGGGRGERRAARGREGRGGAERSGRSGEGPWVSANLGLPAGLFPAPGPCVDAESAGPREGASGEGWEARTRPRSVGLVGGPAKSRPGVIPSL